MKRMICFIITLLFFVSTSYSAKTIYQLDSAHSFVLWHIDHFGFSQQTGKLFADGTIVIDEQNLQNSRVNATVQIASVDTGNRDLNQSLQGDLFFSAGSYPLATFVSNKVVPNGSDKADIYGVLTIRGVTKHVLLKAKFNKKGESVITNKQTIGFTGTTRVSRSDYGITTLLPGLGDIVELEIEVEGYKVA